MVRAGHRPQIWHRAAHMVSSRRACRCAGGLTILPRLTSAPRSTSPGPAIDAVAAARWRARVPPASVWLHEEVGRRMAERLQWIRHKPVSWIDWEPATGGRQVHELIRNLYPGARVLVDGEDPRRALAALAGRGWSGKAQAWFRRIRPAGPQETVDLLWANMSLHQEADPEARLRHWHARVGVGGFLMFSCLGPDTLRELRAVHHSQGWPPATQDFVDMHDWGDILVQSGFAEPVMDMERLQLTYTGVDTLLEELRGLGRNLHPARWPSLRGKAWGQHYRDVLARELPRSPDGRLTLTFEIIYGHAFKAAARERPGDPGSISLDDMRAMLRASRS